MVPHTETMEKVYVNMCPRWSIFKAMTNLNFRTFKDTSMPRIS